MAFTRQIKIHFDDADPAGICFYGNVFSKIHQVYEDFIEELDINAKEWFLNPKLIIPIRHTEANFLKPLFALESYQVQVSPINISDSSFRLLFVIGKKDENHCNIITTHTCFDPVKKEKRLLPDHLRKGLQERLIKVDPA